MLPSFRPLGGRNDGAGSDPFVIRLAMRRSAPRLPKGNKHASGAYRQIQKGSRRRSATAIRTINANYKNAASVPRAPAPRRRPTSVAAAVTRLRSRRSCRWLTTITSGRSVGRTACTLFARLAIDDFPATAIIFEPVVVTASGN